LSTPTTEWTDKIGSAAGWPSRKPWQIYYSPMKWSICWNGSSK